MHVFGVRLSTIERSSGKPNTGVSDLFKELEKHDVKELGLEYIPQPLQREDKRQPSIRYLRAVALRAKRKGIKITALADSPGDRLLGLFQNHLHDEMLFWESKEAIARGAARIGEGPDVDEESRKVALMLKTMLQHVPDLKREHLGELYEALGVQMSLRMHRTAETTGLNHIAVGAAHAENLNFLRKTSMTIVGAGNTTTTLHKRLSDHSKYRSLLGKLEQIADGAN